MTEARNVAGAATPTATVGLRAVGVGRWEAGSGTKLKRSGGSRQVESGRDHLHDPVRPVIDVVVGEGDHPFALEGQLGAAYVVLPLADSMMACRVRRSVVIEEINSREESTSIAERVAVGRGSSAIAEFEESSLSALAALWQARWQARRVAQLGWRLQRAVAVAISAPVESRR